VKTHVGMLCRVNSRSETKITLFSRKPIKIKLRENIFSRKSCSFAKMFVLKIFSRIFSRNFAEFSFQDFIMKTIFACQHDFRENIIVFEHLSNVLDSDRLGERYARSESFHAALLAILFEVIMPP
jgi:hypothetical protein